MDYSAWLGLVLGMAIGGAYAWLQIAALRKNERLMQEQGKSRGPAAMLPGSMMRVAFLLIALVLVQVLVVPENKTPRFYWCLTGALVVTYSVPFFWKLKNLWSSKK